MPWTGPAAASVTAGLRPDVHTRTGGAVVVALAVARVAFPVPPPL